MWYLNIGGSSSRLKEALVLWDTRSISLTAVTLLSCSRTAIIKFWLEKLHLYLYNLKKKIVQQKEKKEKYIKRLSITIIKNTTLFDVHFFNGYFYPQKFINFQFQLHLFNFTLTSNFSYIF